MEQKKFLENLGFYDNPFQYTNADEEEQLQSYFIPPPYFGSVWGDPRVPKSNIIFAPRGGGKSAQRRMIEQRAEQSDIFVITYDRFEGLSGLDLNTLGIEYHLRNIIGMALLGFLLECYARPILPAAFSNSEREQIAALSDIYLGRIAKWEALEALKSLKTLSAKAREALQKWTGPLNTLVSTVMASQGIPPSRIDLGQGGSEVVSDRPNKFHLEVVRDLLKSVGFNSIYVLVDKVDETPETGNNAEASFLLMKPLLRDLGLLQMKGFGFKFFLWNKLELHYREYARPDRIEQFELSWGADDINRMLSRRPEVFSRGKVKDLGELTDANLARPLHLLVVLFAGGSPRDMIRICQDILSEQLQVGPEEEKIGLQAILLGIEKFSTRRARELLTQQVLQELTKTARLDFTTNYVANDVFKIEVNSARNKISQWMKTGAVEKVGQLYTGGRPIYHYAVTDLRIAKAILPQVSLVDFLNKNLNFCEKCATPLARNWDLLRTQTCHKCREENTFS